MYTPTMERVARGFVAGVAVGGTTYLLFKVNDMVLNMLAAVNMEVARALFYLIRRPCETCDVDWKPPICCQCGDDCSCEELQKQELKPQVYHTMSDNKLKAAPINVIVDGVEEINHKEDIASMHIGLNLLKENPTALPKAMAAGLSLIHQAQKDLLPEDRDMTAGYIFTVHELMVDVMNLVLETVSDVQRQMRESWRDQLCSPLAAEYIAWDKKTSSRLQAEAVNLAKLSAQLNTTC